MMHFGVQNNGIQGVNFTIVLQAVFMQEDLKSAKRH